MDWSLQESREFLEKFEVVRKKNRIEAENCLVNLEKYKTELEAGHKPQNIHRDSCTPNRQESGQSLPLASREPEKKRFAFMFFLTK